MSQLRVTQVSKRIRSLYEDLLDLSDISESDSGRDPKILSRCLAAHAVYIGTGCTAEEAASSIWDGTGDNGIDAVFADQSSERVLVVQSKWIQSGSGQPSASDIGLFADGIRDLVEQDIEKFHPRLHARIAEAAQFITTPGWTIEVVLISTGESDIASHGTAKLDGIISILNGPSDPVATKKVLGLSEVYKSLTESSANERITIDATITDWSYIAQPYPAYFGVIDGYQLKQLSLAHGKRLFAKNIRHSLGATDVNESIKGTAELTPAHFWYFNNGITLIADEALRAPAAAASRSAGNFQFKGASIVNGAQTVSALARVEVDEALGQVRVPLRVILLNDAPEGFGGEVTRTNNLQNRVEGRDFVSQDAQQIRLQEEMSMEGVEYQILRSSDTVRSPHTCELIEVTTALACASGDPTLAVQVKTGIGRFFNDLSKAPYKIIFNPQTTGARAFNATLIQREIDNWIDRKKASLEKRSGYPWGVLVHGNRVLSAGIFRLIGSDTLNRPVDELRERLDSLPIAPLGDKFHAAMVESLELEFPGKFLAVLFKSPTSSARVFEIAVQKCSVFS